ncbi:hypothetical protein, partial [Segatella hominis]|uniref:hypothetical protein n=1 Tax=Segatella hominis TaxID=2518605 RepID=UPI003AB62432
ILKRMAGLKLLPSFFDQVSQSTLCQLLTLLSTIIIRQRFFSDNMLFLPRNYIKVVIIYKYSSLMLPAIIFAD